MDLLPFDVELKTIFYVLLYLLVFFLASYVLSDTMFGLTSSKLNRISVYNLSINKSYYLCVLTIVISCSVLSLVHVNNGFVPILGGDDINALRVQSMVGKGRFVIPSFALLYVSNCILIVIHHLLNSTLKKTVALFLLSISFLMIMSFGFRSPAFYLLLTIFILKLSLSDYYQRKIGISNRLVILFTIFVSALVVSGLVRDGITLTSSSFTSLFYSFSVNLFNLNAIIETYPKYEEFLYGYSFVNDLMAVIPGLDGMFLGNYLKDTLLLDFDGSSISVTAIGEGYVNFGVFGIVIHALFLGAFSGLAYSIMNRQNTIWSRVYLVVFSISFARVVTGGFSAILFFSILPNIILITVFYMILRKKVS
ncbi:hypothetical protein A6D94_18320 [Vibrio splendidus]|nr:hypothetical protein A6D94_18320 [Vibrio splendidus]